MKEKYPEDKAVKTWKKGDMTFSIIKIDYETDILEGHYCGYVRFPKKLFRGEKVNYNGFLTYIPVTGGLTYANEDKEGVVYGFDCAHVGDDQKPELKDLKWLKKHCELMGEMLSSSKEAKQHYDCVKSNKKKAEIIDEFRALFKRRKTVCMSIDNMGVMVNLLSGKL